MEGARPLAPVFHSDETFLDEPPAVCSLRVHAVAADGGDTEWVDLQAAYAALPPAAKQGLQGSEALHRTLDGDREVWHPLVCAHPRTGRACLYVNRLFTRVIRGVAPEHDLTLAYLLEHVERTQFRCRVSWRVGDVAFWDNSCTVHRVVDDFSTYRRTERVAVGTFRPSMFVERPGQA